MQVVLPGRPYDLNELWEFFCYHSAPFREDRVFTFTKDWVREAFSVMDPTKQTRINLPKDFVFLNRITFGLNSIMLGSTVRELPPPCTGATRIRTKTCRRASRSSAYRYLNVSCR